MSNHILNSVSTEQQCHVPSNQIHRQVIQSLWLLAAVSLILGALGDLLVSFRKFPNVLSSFILLVSFLLALLVIRFPFAWLMRLILSTKLVDSIFRVLLIVHQVQITLQDWSCIGTSTLDDDCTLFIENVHWNSLNSCILQTSCFLVNLLTIACALHAHKVMKQSDFSSPDTLPTEVTSADEIREVFISLQTV